MAMRLQAMLMTLFLAGASTTASAASRLVVFPTQAEVEVDSNGVVVAVMPASGLSPAIAKAIQTDVGQWQFSAPTKDGHSVGGVTFVQLDACAAPKDDKYEFVVRYRGNGPGHVGPLVPPAYPQEALRFGAVAKLKITFRILPDGSAKAEGVAFLEGGKAFTKAFRSAASSWIEGNRFQPEKVDGQPVSTRESYVLEFNSGVGPRLGPGVTERLSECQAALGARDANPQRLALDSPFHLLPAN